MNQVLASADRVPVATIARRGFAVHGWIGLGLLAVFWPLNWVLPGA